VKCDVSSGISEKVETPQGRHWSNLVWPMSLRRALCRSTCFRSERGDSASPRRPTGCWSQRRCHTTWCS